MNTSEVLNRAADLIEERGWATGSEGWSDGGSLCLEGAIAAAVGVSDELGKRLAVYQCPAYWAVADYLALNPIPTCAPIADALWQWNDARGRTATEVIEVLRAAALIEAAKENADTRAQVSA